MTRQSVFCLGATVLLLNFAACINGKSGSEGSVGPTGPAPLVHSERPQPPAAVDGGAGRTGVTGANGAQGLVATPQPGEVTGVASSTGLQGLSCVEGQHLTSGHCCWPGQTWSGARSECTGIPQCPGGMQEAAGSCARVEPKTGLLFAYIPGGSFHLGCEPGDSWCQDVEKPGRTIVIGSFWLGKTEVTEAAYEKCVASGVCGVPDPLEDCNWHREGRRDHPMNCIVGSGKDFLRLDWRPPAHG